MSFQRLQNILQSSATLCAMAAIFAAPAPAAAQTQVEGSRPGQTYRIGESTDQQQGQQQGVPQQQPQYAPQGYPAQPAQPYAGQSVTGYPVQGQPVQGQPVQAQMPAPAQGRAAAPGVAPTSSPSRALPPGTPVIMEFSDLQCPDSARFNNELKQTIMQRYVGEGKAVYQWHDFPLPSHAQAPEAAAAARCAGPAADRMRQMIMDNQGQMSTTAYSQHARQLGVNPEAFTACMRNGYTMQEVQRDLALGQSYGVKGTPTIVLGRADATGNVRPVKTVKAYDPPEQVLAELDQFMAQASGPAAGSAQ